MMKYFIFTTLLRIMGLMALVQKSDNLNQAYIYASIYDEQGMEVWSLEKPMLVNMVDNQPQIILGKKIPLYETYLDYVKARKLTVWIDSGKGKMIHYKDFNLKDVSIKSMIILNDVIDIKKENKENQKSNVQKEQLEKAPPVDHLKWRQLQKGGDIDFQQILETREIIKTRLDAQSKNKHLRDAGLNAWNFLGPGNIGGRVRAIAVKPRAKNTEPYEIFIGAAGGGIWRSTDGGASWNAINDFLPSLAVTSIVINPVNHDIMYASTGEEQTFSMGLPGAGIFKSTNGGLNWTQLPSTANLEFYWVNKLAIHPSFPNIIYAVTSTAK